MKRLISIVAIIAAVALARPVAAQSVMTSTDQVDGVESVYLPIVNSGNARVISIDVVFTEVGGTTDGWVSLMAKNNGSSYEKVPLAGWADWINYSSALDSLQITDGATWKVEIHDPGFTNYQVRVKGTAGDTTSVTMYYQIKR